MQLNVSPTSVASIPAVSATGTAGYFAAPDDSSQTIVTNDCLNGILAELKNVIEASGQTLDINDNTQLLNALRLGGANYAVTTSSVANQYLATFSARPYTALTAGLMFYLKIHASNTNASAATLTVDALTTKNIKLLNGLAPLVGQLKAGMVAQVVYDGTNFILLNPDPVVSYTIVSGSQTVAAAALDEFTSATFIQDPNSFWDNTNHRFFPQRAGVYRLNCHSFLTSGGALPYEAIVNYYVNNVEVARFFEDWSTGPNITLGSSYLVSLTNTDFITIGLAAEQNNVEFGVTLSLELVGD
jgi:hypothetical protein